MWNTNFVSLGQNNDVTLLFALKRRLPNPVELTQYQNVYHQAFIHVTLLPYWTHGITAWPAI